MPCLIVLLALAAPRAVLVFVWLLTDWVRAAYASTLWPVLGFIFMPYTTLAYMGAMLNTHHSVSGLWLVLVVLAVLADLGSSGSGGQATVRVQRRRQRPET